MKIVQPIRDKNLIETMKIELKKTGMRNYVMFVMGLNTGLRITDLLQLQVKDVKDKTHLYIYEKKTGKNKRFKLNNTVQETLKEYTSNMNNEDYLFPSQKSNKPILRVQAYKILNKASRKIGIKGEIGTHTMRKTFGYFHYKKYKDVAILQDIFNHSAPSITLRYIGINQDIIDQTIDGFEL